MKSDISLDRRSSVEWPTVALILLCTALWLGATAFSSVLTLWVAIPLTAFAITLHSSLQHEVIHGHPTRWVWLNELMVSPSIGLVMPYERAKATHIAHHANPNIAEPFEDPESRYEDKAVWARMSPFERRLRQINNTLLGRVTIGPALALWDFYKDDWQTARNPAAPSNERRDLIRAYALHGVALVPVGLWFTFVADMPIWAFLVACYLGVSVLLIRTFLEHQAHERHAARTVIIEDTGPLSLLFLNNNLHAVHHARPTVAWYRLPALYRQEREKFLAHNGCYLYRSYLDVISRYFFCAKDPVPYPLKPSRTRTQA